MLPAIFGLESTALTDSERQFFREVGPAGYILFGRNVENRQQLRALTDSLRELSGTSDIAILVDQEGGRVARLSTPEWPLYPPAMQFAHAYSRDPERACYALACNYEALALDLIEVGITVNCAPVLDVPVPGAHDVIGDRAFGTAPETVATLASAVLEGMARAGVIGVIKHIPGHGRAQVDSHASLPRVNASAGALAQDIAPFQQLAHAPMAMTAHITYDTWDTERCATLSPVVIHNIIREQVGFNGLLMSDDLDMKALSGSVPELALQALEAGCDLALNCWGKMDDMQGMAALLPPASVAARVRLAEALSVLRPLPNLGTITQRQEALVQERDAILAALSAD